MRRLILRSHQSPGDILMLTAAVRDLHAACPGQFQTDVRTSADALWLHNPHLTRLSESEPGVEALDMHYPLIHQSNQRPYHFLHGYAQYLEQRLGLKIPVTRFAGDVHLSDEERSEPPQLNGQALPERFWIIIAGGKYDFTAKWWNPASYQAVVDHFRDRLHFVQCGEAGHWHPPLQGVTNFVGQTSLRDLVRLMHFADGVVCPVTLAMHLAAAVPTHPLGPPNRACVVIAGGREPPHWEAYPQHQYLHTIGQLDCCQDGGCWKSRCQPVGDGDDKDRRNRCERPVAVSDSLVIPQCLDLISPQEVIGAIERTLKGWGLRNGTSLPAKRCTALVETPLAASPTAARPKQVLLEFRHGLGDAVQFTAVLRHLKHYHPDWEIDVAALVGKHSAFRGLCRRVLILDRDPIDRTAYDVVTGIEWNENRVADGRWPSTKVTRCLQDLFQLTPIPDLCRYQIEITEDARQAAREYLESVCGLPDDDGRYRAILIHYEGNTSADRKNLPTEAIRQLCRDLIQRGLVPIILDWDRRSPLPDGRQIFCPTTEHPLWERTGTGDAERLAALIDSARLMIGIDSGPLHVAGATSTPTIGVWTKHHPLHYFDLAPQVVHLVPAKHLELVHSAAALTYFGKAYRSRTYQHLTEGLIAAVHEALRGWAAPDADAFQEVRGFWVRSDNISQDLVVVQDVFEQDSYRIDDLPLPRPFVVDVGAHIGCFSKRLAQRFPDARIVAVECCPENIPVLERNLGGIATVVQGAVTYESDVALLNAVYPECISTGGSILLSREELQRRQAAAEVASGPQTGKQSGYWADLRPIRTLSLEDILREQGADRIDLLKLDCEGSEYSILRNTSSLDRIGLIVGEYHGRERFDELVRERFGDWDLRILKEGEFGLFWLSNPRKQTRPGSPPPETVSSTREGTDCGERPDAASSAEIPLTSRLDAAATGPFWSVLEPRLHPQDQPAPATWRPCYEVKFALARLIRPRSILEIGVRAGYSALAFLTACPEASYVGIDNNGDMHGGFRGALDHARELLAPFQAVLLEMTSAAYGEQLRHDPDQSAFDLVHVDGDHSLAGCLADLRLADRLQPRVILVDDVLGIPEVQSACDQFLRETQGRWLSLVIPDAHNGVRVLVTNPLTAAVANGGGP